ncbi:MAG TPA: hypothetical protein VG964_01020 [Candidatus Saccharimonadales bacterium]|nr:hypothetical protein [Candidatus Saccharimonadales bacterium]
MALALKSTGVYAALLRAYPRSFREHYGGTMVQTFDDMLDGEPSWFGRSLIWVRTLINLPFSATREHLVSKEELNMNRNMKLFITTTVIAILIVGMGSFWFGNLHARQATGVEKVSAAQLADAMQKDDFYSQYGDSAVVFNAKVASITHGKNAALVTFTTNRPYSVTCQFPQNIAAKNGQNMSIVAPAGSAERQKHGVLLHDCVEN